MTQTIVLKKLAAFLNCLPRDQTREPYVQEIEKLLLERGFCFGLSVCHGAMDLMGKLDWWEDVLKTISLWDESRASLNNKIHLINENDATNPPTLKQIFERALNYIVFYHMMILCDFELKNGEQHNLLRPNDEKQSNFEFVNGSGKIETPKRYETASGYFLTNDFIQLLDENHIANSITLIHNNYHTIRIGYQKPHWILYDPNYNHQASPIYKKYDKKALVHEVQRLLGKSIAITTALFNAQGQPIFPTYLQLQQNNPLRLIVNEALSISAKYSPEALTQILQSATTNNGQNAKLIKALSVALVEKAHCNWPGLHILIRYSPKTIPLILQMMDSSEEGIQLKHAVASTLAETNHIDWPGLNYSLAYYLPFIDWTGLHSLAYHLPDSLNVLLKMMDNSESGIKLKIALSFALAKKNKNNLTGLHFIVVYAPNALPALLKLIDNSEAGIKIKNAIATALFEFEKIDNESVRRLTETQHGKRLLRKFPQHKQKFFPEQKLLLKRDREVVINSTRAKKRQRLDFDGHSAVLQLETSEAKPTSSCPKTSTRGLFAPKSSAEEAAVVVNDKMEISQLR